MEPHARRRPGEAMCLHITSARGRPVPAVKLFFASSSEYLPQQISVTPVMGLAGSQLACLAAPVAASHGAVVTPRSEEGKR